MNQTDPQQHASDKKFFNWNGSKNLGSWRAFLKHPYLIFCQFYMTDKELIFKKGLSSEMDVSIMDVLNSTSRFKSGIKDYRTCFEETISKQTSYPARFEFRVDINILWGYLTETRALVQFFLKNNFIVSLSSADAAIWRMKKLETYERVSNTIEQLKT